MDISTQKKRDRSWDQAPQVLGVWEDQNAFTLAHLTPFQKQHILNMSDPPKPYTLGVASFAQFQLEGHVPHPEFPL